MRLRIGRILAAGAGLVAVAATGLALAPAGVPVETGAVVRGPLAIHVEGSGRVRVRDRFVVAAPVSGHLHRVTARAGDAVQPGEVIARMSAATPFPLDARSRAEASARLEAALAAAADAGNAVEQARAASAQAKRERDRLKRLSEGQVIAPRDLDAAEYEANARARAVTSAEYGRRSAASAVEAARAALARIEQPSAAVDEPVVVPAPDVDGPLKVLRVLAEQEGPVAAGTPLVELGDPARVEAITDLLTTDAVRVARGAPVSIEGWGGSEAITGRVRLVEPSAFTKVSALGVEEQRVLVVIDPENGPWERLSDGWRIEARITVWERADARKVPAAALFREDGGWAVFAAREGKAVKTRVEIGERGPREAEVTAGLEEGDMVVLFPGDKLADGARVEPVVR